MKQDAIHTEIARQVRASKSSFYWAMRLQDLPRRQALFALYAFAHAIDDIVDGEEATAVKRATLENWRSWFSHGGTIDGYESLSIGLAEVIDRFTLPQEPFLALIAGMESDASGPIVAPTWTALETYCGQVAGAVGELCLSIWGWRGDTANSFASATGEALQLTNILRDISEDAKAGRLYIPEEALSTASIDTRLPAKVLADRNFPRACDPVFRRADQRFADAQAMWPINAERTLRPAWIMLRSYEALFRKVRDAGVQPDGKRVRLSKIEKLFHFLAAYLSCP
ncbi:MAG: squalene/phytoene synthase family protein [Rhodospirillaceae bacterium]|nr:squalene/phytoene synthase family protein [Rhodospirillaceae bacterium]